MSRQRSTRHNAQYATVARGRGFTAKRKDGSIYHQDRMFWDSSTLGTYVRSAHSSAGVAAPTGERSPGPQPVPPAGGDRDAREGS